MNKRAPKEGYYRVGAELRTALIAALDACGCEDKARATKIKTALQLAAPQRDGYLLDVHGWTSSDVDFLKETIDSLAWSNFLSRGFSFGKTALGQQIQALGKKL